MIETPLHCVNFRTTSDLVSTWMGDRLETPDVVGFLVSLTTFVFFGVVLMLLTHKGH